MNSEHIKSSEQLHKEVLEELDKVEMDIDEMRGRLSPGQLIDDAIFYPHGGDVTAAFDHLKRNPVGSSFLAIGTLLLMEDEGESYEAYLKTKARSTVEEAKKGMSAMKQGYYEGKEQAEATSWEDLTQTDQFEVSEPGLGDKAKSRFNTSKVEAKEKITELKEGLRERSQDIKHKVQDFKEGFKSKSQEFQGISHDLREEARHKGEAFREGAKQKFSSAKEAVSGLDPLAFAAIGLGLGALTGASLPVTEKEKNLVDDKLGQRISNFKDDLQEALDKSTGVLKDALISDFKNVDLEFFKKKGGRSSSPSPGL